MANFWLFPKEGVVVAVKGKSNVSEGWAVVETAAAPGKGLPSEPALSSLAQTLLPLVESWSATPSLCQPNVVAMLPAGALFHGETTSAGVPPVWFILSAGKGMTR